MPPAFDGAFVFASKGGDLDTLEEFAIVDRVPLRDFVSFSFICYF